MKSDSPWQSAYDEFNTAVLPRLKKIGKQIGIDAGSGMKQASEVVRIYSMLHKSFDPMTMMLLQDAMKKYEEAK
jgi:hypothetical protein